MPKIRVTLLLTRAVRRVYKASLALSLRMNAREERVLIKANTKKIDYIDSVQRRAEKILASVQRMEDDANLELSEGARELLSINNELQNLRDGA